jgi:hypothetical protein
MDMFWLAGLVRCSVLVLVLVLGACEGQQGRERAGGGRGGGWD